MLRLVFAVLLLALTVPALAADAYEALFGRESHDLAAELATANAAGKPLLVMFETADCEFCAEMRRKVFVQAAVRDFYRRNFHTVAVRLDAVAMLRDPLGVAIPPTDLARRHGLAGTPGFAFFDPQGQLLSRHQGALAGADDFLALGRYVLARAYETESFAAWRKHAAKGFNSGIVVARPRLDFAFTDGQRQPRRLKDLRGRVVLLAFGYTHCPDVCPTTLAEMAALRKQLGPTARRVELLFVSVDAERDTPTVMGNYARAFDARIRSGVIDPVEIGRLRQSAGLVVDRQPGPTGYSVDHSAGFFILDAKGRLRLRSDYGQDVAAVLADIHRLLAMDGKRS